MNSRCSGMSAAFSMDDRSRFVFTASRSPIASYARTRAILVSRSTGSGVGAIFYWSGNKKVGEGRMTITDSQPDKSVRIRIEFMRPFKATNIAEFTFEPQGAATNVTWSMTGERNFVSKAFCLFINMDKMVGGDFEKGLSQLKSVVEKSTVEAR